MTTGETRPTPIPYEELGDGAYLWFTERGGTVIHGVGDAEGNLGALSTLDGRDLLDDDYAGYIALSTDGAKVAYTDHSDLHNYQDFSYSHFWSPVVVVKDTLTGAELGRWALGGPVNGLEFSDSWLLVGEGNPDGMARGDVEQVALVAINVDTGATRRVETSTSVFQPT